MLDALTRANGEEELHYALAVGLRDATPCDNCDILLRDESGGLVMAASTLVPQLAKRCRLGRGLGLVGRSVERDEPIVVSEGLASHPDFVDYPELPESAYESAVVVPMHAASGAVGVAVLRRRDPWNPEEVELTTIRESVDAVGVMIQAYRSAFLAGARSTRLGQASEVARTVAGSPYLEEILQLLVNLTAQQFNYKVCTVRLLDETSNELVLRATQSPVKAYQRKPAIRLGESIAGRAIVEGSTIIVPDVQMEREYIGHDLAREQGLRSMICVPLAIHGRAVGVLTCYTDEVREFPRDEVDALESLARQVAVSIQHAKLQVRSTLMQEMNHRVKNSLQQVASLLRLQLSQPHAPTLEHAIHDSLARILAIASVHELLSREDLDHVGAMGITEALLQSHRISLVSPEKRIALSAEGDDVRVNMTQATQLALVLNELIQNAVEHGFAERDEGRVTIRLSSEGEDVRIAVTNDGAPLPADFDVQRDGHLGMRIVDSLVRGLGGTFQIASSDGETTAEVVFSPRGPE